MSDPIASVDELSTYLGLGTGAAEDIDTDRATLILQLAHDKCEAVVSPVPDAAKGVELDVSARAYTNPSAETSQAPGPYGIIRNTLIGGLWLTKANIADLRRFAGASSAFTIDPTPADAEAGDYWPQIPESPEDVWGTPPYYGDFDSPPVS